MKDSTIFRLTGLSIFITRIVLSIVFVVSLVVFIVSSYKLVTFVYEEPKKELENFLMQCWDAENQTVLSTDYCLEADESTFKLVWGKDAN